MRNRLRSARRIFWFLLWAGAMLVLGLLSLGFVYKERVEAYLLQQIGQYLAGRVYIERMELDLIRTWPQASVRLQQVRVHLHPEQARHFGMGQRPVLEAQELQVSLNLLSLLRGGAYRIQGIRIHRPRLRLVRDPTGLWNYQRLLKPRPDDQALEEALDWHLQALEVSEAELLLDDHHSQQHYTIRLAQLSLSGAFRRKELSLRLAAQGSLHRAQIGQLVLPRISAIGLAGTLVQQPSGHVRVDARLQLQQIPLTLSGYYSPLPAPALDVRLNTGRTTLAQLYSLLPAPYRRQLNEQATLGGALQLAGRYHGPLGGTTLELSAHIRQGSVMPKAYPQAALKDLSAELALYIPPDLRKAYLHLQPCTGTLGGQPIRASLQYDNFLQPKLSVAAQAQAPLRSVALFWPQLLSYPKADGQLSLDVSGQGPPDELQIRATLTLADARVQHPAMRWPVEGLSARLHYEGETLRIEQLSARCAHSDLQAQGSLTGLTSQQPVLRLLASARQLDLNELLGLWKETEKPEQQAGKPDAHEAAWQLQLQLQAQQLNWDSLRADGMQVGVAWQDNQLKLDNLRIQHLRWQQLQARQLAASASWSPGALRVSQCEAQLLAGRISGSFSQLEQPEPYLQTTLKLQDIDLKQAFVALPKLGEFLVIGPYTQGQLSGQMEAQAPLDAQGEPLTEGIRAQGTVQLRQLRIYNFPPMRQMGLLIGNRFENMNFEDFQSRFRISRGRFQLTDTLELYVNRTHLEVSGGHHLEGLLDYRVRVQLAGLLGLQQQATQADVAELVEETQPAADAGAHAQVRIRGTVDNPEVSLDKQALRQGVEKGLRNERDELRQRARKAR
ncbi:MAG: hypothetical protein LW884_10230 [Bacteroidetes bacterium]|nr:hypothetical protein [Bacteroidota bacterium]